MRGASGLVPRSGTLRGGLNGCGGSGHHNCSVGGRAPVEPLAGRAAGRCIPLDALAARSHVAPE
jgi:hypothetical protein